MPKLHAIQQSFSSGEVTPLGYSRSDAPGFKASVSEMVNMVPDARGPAVRRRGAEYIGRAVGNSGRLATLQITDLEYYLLLFTNLRLDISTEQGMLPGNNLVTNPNFENGSTDWPNTVSTGSTVTFSNNQCHLNVYTPKDSTLVNPDYTSGGTGWSVRESHNQSIVIFVADTCELDPRNFNGAYAGVYQAVNTPFPTQEHQVTVNVVTTNAPCRLKVGTGENDGSYLDREIPAVIGSYTFSFTPALADYTVTFDCPSTANRENVVITSLDVSEPVDGHYSSISQSVTTSEVGMPHVAAVDLSGLDDTSGGGKEAARIRIGTTQYGGEYYDNYTAEVTFTNTFVATGATIWITIDSEYPIAESTIDVEFVAIYETQAGGDPVGFDTPYAGDEVATLQYIDLPVAGAIYVVHKNHPPYKLTYTPLTQVWAFESVTFTSPPAEWATGNYPATGCVFQGRLWLGGPNETWWGSVSGSYEDFTTGSTESDAQVFTLDHYGAIRWMAGIKNLLVGTENSEYVIKSHGGIIWGGDIQVERQSTYGSAEIQVQQVGDQIFYVSPDRTKLRSMQYEWTANNWLSTDLTFMAEHITQGRIKSLTWAQNPRNVMFITLEDGNGVVFSYDRPNGIYGWARYETDGQVIDATSGRKRGTDELSMIVQRVPGEMDLEIDDTETEIYMDSWTNQYNYLGSTVVEGLDQHEGKWVQVVTDGALHPPRFVYSGQITLQWSAQEVYVGLPYRSSLKTLPIAYAGQDGTTMGHRKRWNKIYLRVLDSERPMINGKRPATRSPVTPMDERELSRTEDIQVVNLGWDQWAQVEIEQDLQVALTVSAIFGELGQNSL